eukprot:5406968-Pyramimonas_sp.AAC.1
MLLRGAMERECGWRPLGVTWTPARLSRGPLWGLGAIFGDCGLWGYLGGLQGCLQALEAPMG